VSGQPFSQLLLLVKKQHFSMKRLYRSKKDRILGGVCAGLGEHLDVDTTVIRLIWAVVSVLSIGTGIIIYILAWIIIPEDDTDGTVSPSGESRELT
jgi:phage shock protein PspC (stress-responsive transcriptional regulator)